MKNADYSAMTLKEFTDLLGSRSAVPSGGGASALTAALGAALGAMVGNLTLGKPRFSAVEAQVQSLTDRLQAIQTRLLAAIDRDAAAVTALGAAYQTEKSAPGRGEAIESALLQAARTPLDIMAAAGEAIDCLTELRPISNPLVASDIATGAVLCWGALYGAAMNVRVNTHLMADETAALALNTRCDALMETGWHRAEAVYEEICGGMGR